MTDPNPDLPASPRRLPLAADLFGLRRPPADAAPVAEPCVSAAVPQRARAR